ncbi:hypothetical protein, partial [Parablautia intestinalis]|uniref:hypothetical protein n=1 Tax=Parablautia intestinalis TaxID=2320100 RepID=UPI00259C7877
DNLRQPARINALYVAFFHRHIFSNSFLPLWHRPAGFCISRQGTVSALVDKNTLETHIGQSVPELLIRKAHVTF